MSLNRNNLIRKIKNGFFKTPLDCLITIILVLAISWATLSTIKWLAFEANWTVVTDNLHLYTFGGYPKLEQWRPFFWLVTLGTLSSLTLFCSHLTQLKKSLPFLWVLIIPFGIFLIRGGIGLEIIPSRNWGGFLLTVILTCCSASIALPLGILLAIGRQTNLKLVNLICRIYIDVMRSVPLIAVLFFGQLLIPLFLPVDLEINRFNRAVWAFGLFAASYVAEDIRGGLQAIPSTQKEAAKVLGLSSTQTFQLIVLPQALRTALPALTNQAIGLLQNTSLMALLGLIELLGISRSILANPEFIGRYLEVYVWLAGVYWFVCTIIALMSRNIERQLDPVKSFK